MTGEDIGKDTGEDNTATRRRNLILGALLVLAALGMYFGIFMKMS